MNKKYILITGGELFNKGAQSMTFTVINEIKKRFPEKEAILLSTDDYERNKEFKEKFAFEILPFNTKLMYGLMKGFYGTFWRLKLNKKNSNKYEHLTSTLEEIFNNAEMMIDISGYALSSQRGSSTSISYLMKIKLAEQYGIKVFLMPQSFGPFNYSGKKKYVINYLLKEVLKYPEMIYAREQEGYNILVNDYKLNNVEKSYDLVLLNKDIELSNIYKNESEQNNSIINDAKGIAIVPNMKNFKHGNSQEILKVYDSCINKLTSQHKKVYLIRHSIEDKEACDIIKERNKQNDNVILLDYDFSCIEYENLIKKFDFAIASRYHSIIHAYKNGIPCIAIGWATKYHELLKTFKQENYIFDVRSNIDEKAIDNAIDIMIENHTKESKVILETLSTIRNKNIFDVIDRSR